MKHIAELFVCISIFFLALSCAFDNPADPDYDLGDVDGLQIEQINDHAVQLSWDEVNDVEGYRILRAEVIPERTFLGIERKGGDDPEFIQLADIEETEYLDETLHVNQEYIYKVYGYKDENETSVADTTFATTYPDITYFAAVALQGSHNVQLTWEIDYDQHSGYKVYRKHSDSSSATERVIKSMFVSKKNREEEYTLIHTIADSTVKVWTDSIIDPIDYTSLSYQIIAFTTCDSFENCSAEVEVTVDNANQLPEMSGLEETVVYAENDTISIADAIMIDDFEDDQISRVEVQISPYDAGNDILTVTPGNRELEVNYANGILTISGAADEAEYQSVLRTLTYHNVSNDPSPEQRTVRFRVFDVVDCSQCEEASLRITIEVVNDLPYFQYQNEYYYNNETITLVTDENTPANLTITAIDEDNDAINWTVTNGEHGNVIEQSKHKRSREVTEEKTYTYSPINEDYNGPDDFTITITEEGSRETATLNIDVNIAAVNDAPVCTTPPSISNTDVYCVNDTITVDPGTWIDNKDEDYSTNYTFVPSYDYQWYYNDGNEWQNTGQSGNEFTIPEDYCAYDIKCLVTCADNGEPGVQTQQAYSNEVSVQNSQPYFVYGDSTYVSGSTLELQVLEDEVLSFTLTGEDPNSNQSFTWSCTQGANGSVSISSTDDPHQETKTIEYDSGDNYNGGDAFTITINDQSSDVTAILNVSVDVEAVNDPPTITSTAITVATEDSPYGYEITAEDIDVGDELTYSAPTKPDWLSFDATTHMLSGTPENDDVGDHDVTLRVSDGTVNVDQTFVISVSNTNDPPTITSTAITVATEDSPYGYEITAEDIDVGDELTYSAPTKPDWLSFDTATHILSGTPDNDDVGDHNVTLRVSDGTVNVDQTFVISVSNTNDPPTITSTAITVATEDSPYGYEITAEDIDVGDELTYSAPTKPDWLSFDATTHMLSGTPDNDDVGDHNVTLRVSDGTVNVDQTFVISVSNTNDPPTITSTAITVATEDSPYSYEITAEDIDVGDELTYSAPTKPDWLSFDTATHILSGTPDNDDVGDHNVTLRVSDGTVNVDQTFVISVSNTNDPPTITSTAITVATEDSPYSYEITAEDIDVGDELTYSAPTKPDWLSFDTATHILSGTPDNDDVGDHDVTLRVWDGTVNVDQTFVISVSNRNDPPVLDNIETTALSYTEGDDPKVITELIEVSDVDDDNLESATIKITSGYHSPEDVLSFTNTLSITGQLSGNVMTLTGPATKAEYQAALRSVKYENTSQNPSEDTRTVSFQVNDGYDNSIAVSRDVTILPQPKFTSLNLSQSLDKSTWDDVTFTPATQGSWHFSMELDTTKEFFYLDVKNSYTQTNIAIADSLYPFYFETVPDNFLPYWHVRGVYEGCSGNWQPTMWEIINSEKPIFYLKHTSDDTFMLVDALQYIVSQGTIEDYFRVNGDYLNGEYEINGKMKGENGVESEDIVVKMTFTNGTNMDQ